MSDTPTKFDLQDAVARVSRLDKPFEVRLEDGDFSIEMFTPRGADTQSPHSRDEIYVVARGACRFQRKDEIVDAGPGDALFVAAWEPHRFIDFSADFATWVIFYGEEKARP